MNRLTRYGLFPLILLIAAVGAAAWWKLRPAPSIESQVLTDTVTRGDLVETVSANGTLNPVTLVSVGTQVSGTALSVHADFNDHVDKGQVLVKLDPASYEAKLQQTTAQLTSAQATLDLARANRARAVDLYGKGYIPKQELDAADQTLKSAQAQVAQTRAQVANSQVDLRNSVIVSPIAGVVVNRTVDVGQTVAASFQTPTLFQIAEDLKKMLIHTTFAEADIGRIEPGQPAKFTVDAHPDRAYVGTVRQVRLNPTTTQNVVTYDVVIDVTNEDLSLLPGMTAYVSIELSRATDVLRVPNAALRYRPKDVAAASAGARGAKGAGGAEGTRHWQGQGGGNGQGGGTGPRGDHGPPGGNGSRPSAPAAPSGATPGAGDVAGAKPEAPEGGRHARVWVIHHGALKAIPVQVGRTDGRLTAVQSDALKEGDVVVTADRVADRPAATTQGPRMRMF